MGFKLTQKGYWVGFGFIPEPKASSSAFAAAARALAGQRRWPAAWESAGGGSGRVRERERGMERERETGRRRKEKKEEEEEQEKKKKKKRRRGRRRRGKEEEGLAGLGRRGGAPATGRERGSSPPPGLEQCEGERGREIH